MAVAAVAAALETNLTKDAHEAVADSYADLQKIVNKRYRSVDFAIVQTRPGSAARQDLLETELAEAGADGDPELRAAAERVLRVVWSVASASTVSAGVRLRRIRAGELEVSRVTVQGSSGVAADEVHVVGRFVIQDVVVESSPDHPSLARTGLLLV
ncbi:hypothetical protein AB0L62_12915 [Nocardia asteroides]|uniref:hypothetical protein n=1 Tax=Nocardia asteroides TaxID=1824 RepID=UPI00341938EF